MAQSFTEKPLNIAGIAFIAALAGAATALLLAPKSGKELRGNVASKMHHTHDKAKATLDDAKATISDTASDLQDTASEAATAIKGKAQDVRK